MRELVCLAIFIIFSTLFAIIMVALGFICGAKKTSQIKESTYECGVVPFGDANVKFSLRYFNYAVLFLIFDVETIFLYPFAVFVNKLGIFAVIEAFLFVAILLLGLYFVIKKRMLRWV